jgi:hypothetical protein
MIGFVDIGGIVDNHYLYFLNLTPQVHILSVVNKCITQIMICVNSFFKK